VGGRRSCRQARLLLPLLSPPFSSSSRGFRPPSIESRSGATFNPIRIADICENGCPDALRERWGETGRRRRLQACSYARSRLSPGYESSAPYAATARVAGSAAGGTARARHSACGRPGASSGGLPGRGPVRGAPRPLSLEDSRPADGAPLGHPGRAPARPHGADTIRTSSWCRGITLGVTSTRRAGAPVFEQ
jgi:hypothetical protein